MCVCLSTHFRIKTWKTEFLGSVELEKLHWSSPPLVCVQRSPLCTKHQPAGKFPTGKVPKGLIVAIKRKLSLSSFETFGAVDSPVRFRLEGSLELTYC